MSSSLRGDRAYYGCGAGWPATSKRSFETVVNYLQQHYSALVTSSTKIQLLGASMGWVEFVLVETRGVSLKGG